MRGRAELAPPSAVPPPGPLHPIRAELIAATGAVLLFVSLFFLKWFGIGAVVGRLGAQSPAAGAEGGWHALTLLRWVMLVAIVASLLPPLMRIGGRWLGRPRRLHAAVATLGTVTALLLGYRVLVDLPDPSRIVDQKVGAILGLIGAAAIAIGGLESARDDVPPRPVRPARGSRSDRRLAREIARINA